MSASLPIIDLAPWFDGDQNSRLKLCARLGEIGHETGFFYIVRHGISQDVTDRYLSMLKAFFALPEEIKQAIDKSESPQFRGWERLGSELTNNQVDYREQIDIGARVRRGARRQ